MTNARIEVPKQHDGSSHSTQSPCMTALSGIRRRFRARTRSTPQSSLLSVSVLGASVMFASCSGKNDTDAGGASPQNEFVPNGTGGVDGASGAGSQHDVSPSDVAFTGDSSGNCKISVQGATCVGTSYEPEYKVVMLLVTDGLPEAPMSCPSAGCCPTLDDAASAAQGCLNGDPRIQTYVLGVGPYLDNLNLIAAAGGTNSAYLVGTGDVASQVLQALNAIRGETAAKSKLERELR